MSTLRTIESVLDTETGLEVLADKFFNNSEKFIFEYRRRQEEAIQGHASAKYICYYCKQPLKIRGGRRSDGGMSQIFHFAHVKDSDDCIIKTTSVLTLEEIRCIKYNGQKESQLHVDTKELIGELLRENEHTHGEVTGVVVDQVYKADPISKKWRKPDVRCYFKEKQVVFEVQLSTDFISVIAGREIYYRKYGLYVLWVFKSFDTRSGRQRFVEKDIFFGNNSNVYVLDEEAIHRSRKSNDLVFRCYYLEYIEDNGKIFSFWRDTFICLRELTFEDSKKISFYFDSDKSLQQARRSVEITEIIDNHQSFYSEEHKQSAKDIIMYADRMREKYPNPSPLIRYLLSNIYDRDNQAPMPSLSYQLTDADNKFLNEEFDSGIEAIKDSPASRLAYCIARFLYLRKARINTLPYSVSRILDALLSLKRNRVIGFGYKNLILLSHKIFESDTAFAKLLVFAMHQYGRYDMLIKEDKSGKLLKKIQTLKSQKPDAKDLNLIVKIFPELKSFQP